MRVYILYTSDYVKRFVETLIKHGDASSIVGMDKIPENLPKFIEEPERYLPANMPKCDVIVAIGIHPDLLTALPFAASKTGAKGVIVPVEDPNWCSPGLQKQVEGDLKKAGVEYAFPKPFCTLTKGGQKSIDAFMDEFKVGRPVFRSVTDGKKIVHTEVVINSPCGAAAFIAERLIGAKLSNQELDEMISEAHHAYPCTGSMQKDIELKDTILHVAGYTVRDAVKKSLGMGLSAGDEDKKTNAA
jgi:hypothetical protein